MPATPIDRAFDDRRPPDGDLIDDCVHCGFCLPTCPTYLLWSEEMDSPRGRIVLMRAGSEAGSTLSPEMARHFDNCLGCLACVTACPSGVRYDKLILDTRQQVERRHPRTVRERLLRRALLAGVPHPGRLRLTVPALVALRRSGLGARLRRSTLVARLPTLRAVVHVAPDVRLQDAVRRLPAVTPAQGARRGTVALLQGCVQRVYFAGVNRATVAVLSAEGFEVHAPPAPRCCGALALHAGHDDEARPRIRETIAALEGYDAVIVNAAGCGSAMKDYAHVLRDDPAWHERARSFAAKVRDVHEVLAGVQPRAPRGRVERRVTYHDACHLAHGQGVRAQPRELLRGIPGLELLEPAEWEICCGSAGIYNLVKPDAADALGARKAEHLLATGPDAIAAGNPGCALQIQSHLERRGRHVPVVHPIELVHESILAGARGEVADPPAHA